jgi:hypothetical protein
MANPCAQSSGYTRGALEAALFGEQQFTLPHYRAHHADFAGRSPRRAQQSETHQLLQPLTVLHVALAAGDILHLARINEPDCQAALLEYLVDGVRYTPVDSSATVSTPQASSRSAIACSSPLVVPNPRTGWSQAGRGTATQWLDAPTSIPAAFGYTPHRPSSTVHVRNGQ